MNEKSKNPKAELAARLKEARELAGLSQGQVAKLMGLHRPSISEIEAGNRRVSAEELTRFAELFDVSAAWLLGEAPDILSIEDPKLQIAARELRKLKPEDLDRLLRLFAAIKDHDAKSSDEGNSK